MTSLKWLLPSVYRRCTITPTRVTMSQAGIVPHCSCHSVASPGRIEHSHNASSEGGSNKASSIRLTMIGPPGAGKGTQAAKMQRDFGLSQISTGTILRRAAEQDTQFGLQIRSILASGALVSDDIMLNIIKECIAKELNVHITGWILDGYPRTPRQASQLDQLLTSSSQPLNIVFYLNVPETVLLDRIRDRWVHPASGRTYNMSYSPPKEPGRDDVTGEPLIRRTDDNPDALKARLKEFQDATLPLIDYYSQTGLLIEIESPTSDIGYIKIKKILCDMITQPA